MGLFNFAEKTRRKRQREKLPYYSPKYNKWFKSFDSYKRYNDGQYKKKYIDFQKKKQLKRKPLKKSKRNSDPWRLGRI